MDMDELRHVIDHFSFERCKNGNQGFNRILIQLFGMLGHGKSSFINTCIYVWQDGEYRNWANANEQDGGHTTERIPYKLTRNIMVVDNRGLPQLDEYGNGEIFAQLGNLLPLGRRVDWSPGFTLVDRIVQSEKSAIYSDFTVPVFVHSVRHTIPMEEMTEMKSMLHTARDMTGIYPIVVLTNKNFGNLTAVESSFRDMGIERIFAFENYTHNDHFKTRGRHEEVLKFLQEVIRDAQFRVEHETRNPVKEMQERKQFVMNHVHKREKKMELQNLERKKALEQAMRKKELQRQEEEFEWETQRRRQAEEEELRRRREQLERQRSIEQARREAELRAEQEAKSKKGKKTFKLFSKKK
ncbi:uncharacterized protein ACMZJ9_009864 [Mantella aurantiaca]